MDRNLTELPFPVSLLSPPYERCCANVVSPAQLSRASLAPGTVLALHLRCPDSDLKLLPRWIPAVRAAHPNAAVILCLDDTSSSRMLRVARAAGSLRVRAVVPRDEPVAAILRRALTEPDDLPGDIVEWLRLRNVPVGPVLGHVIQQMFALAHEYAEVTDLLRTIGEPETSARFRFRKKGLPSPRRWLQAARALQIAMRLQAEPRTSLMEVALELGYSDHSAISQAIMRTFRLRPGKLRETLGWEWLLDRWLEAEMSTLRQVA